MHSAYLQERYAGSDAERSGMNRSQTNVSRDIEIVSKAPDLREHLRIASEGQDQSLIIENERQKQC
jgi:hypothetical protein